MKMTLRQIIRSRVSNKTINQAIKSGIPIDEFIKNRFKRCKATNRDGTQCKARAYKDKNVCTMHGGLSTGPKTEAGKKKALANLKQNRKK